MKEQIYNEKTKLSESVLEKEPVIAKASAATLDRHKIQNYAYNNYKNPKTGRSGVPYINFAGSGGDCTNFVSHALLAGGATQKVVSGTYTSTGWFCKSSSNRSQSWTGVTKLHAFIKNNTKKGPAGTWKTLTSSNWNVGNIMQFKSGSSWVHSSIITGSTTSSAPLVTYRSTTGGEKRDKKASEVYSGTKRIVQVKNYS